MKILINMILFMLYFISNRIRNYLGLILTVKF